jgi:hypothetical protein
MLLDSGYLKIYLKILFNLSICICVINCWFKRYGWSLTRNIDPITGEPEYTVGKILLIFFNIIIGVFSLGNAGPYVGTLASARAAAYEIFKIIDRVRSKKEINSFKLYLP